MNCIDIVKGSTYVYGIIGCPVDHSFSPILQNTINGVMGMSSVYVPFPVKEGEAENAVAGAYSLGIQGLNVTVPHKKTVMNKLCAIDTLAEQIGAVNTLKRTEKGYKGYNTDILGLKKALEAWKVQVKGERIVIAGAGGAAPSAAMLMSSLGASEIILVNRTLEKAEALKQQILKFYSIPIKVVSYDTLNACGKPALFVQTTSLGMGATAGESPIEDKTYFKGIPKVMDIIYSPWKTKLMEDAKEMGCAVKNGFDMLIYQGIASFEIWNDTAIPEEKAIEMKNILERYYLKE